MTSTTLSICVQCSAYFNWIFIALDFLLVLVFSKSPFQDIVNSCVASMVLLLFMTDLTKLYSFLQYDQTTTKYVPKSQSASYASYT